MEKFDPSVTLARLAATLHRWTIKAYPVDRWTDEVERKGPPARRNAKPVAEWPLEELEFESAVALGLCDHRIIPNAARFAEVLAATNLLDDWHQPLCDYVPGHLLSAAHAEAWARLSDKFGFSNVEDGILIPRSCMGLSPPVDARRASLPNAVLHSTTFVPLLVDAGDPNSTALKSGGRRIAVRYKPASLLSMDPRPAPGSRPVVAVAPVHQTTADARVRLLEHPDRYGLEILEGSKRLPDIIRRAVEGDAHLLFLPEMAIDATHLPDLAGLIRRECARYLGGHGRLPALRNVVAGCVSCPTESAAGRNYVVVLDHLGRTIACQRKLSRWNLKAHHQFNYGLRKVFDADAGEVFEDIEEGQEVCIIDLHGLGRLATLICADMSYDDPGDFLIRNVNLDWLHAPIMDRTNVLVRSAGSDQPWMIERAVRAAENGARRVIVTNSALFTSLINVVNARDGSEFPPYSACSIAFMLDNTPSGLLYRDVQIDMPPTATVLDCAPWQHGFEAFPPPMR